MRKVVALLVAALGVAVAVTVGAQESASLALESSVVTENAAVTGAVGGILPGVPVQVTWTDPFGAVLYATTVQAAGGGPAGFSFAAAGQSVPTGWVSAAAPQVAERRMLTVLPASDDFWSGFSITVTPAPEATPGNAMALRALGITGGMGEGYQSALAAASVGLRPLPANLSSSGVLSLSKDSASDMASAYEASGAPEGLMRRPSLSDPNETARIAQELSLQSARIRDLAPAGMVVATDPSTAYGDMPLDVSFAPEDLAAFNRYLAVRAPLLALPESSTVPAGGEVRTIARTAREMKESILAASGDPVNLAPWGLHREFMDALLAQTISDMSRAAISAAQAPGDSNVNWNLYRPVTGFSGALAPAAYGGWDWTVLPKAANFAVMSPDAPEWSWALARDLLTAGSALARIDASAAGADETLWSAAADGLSGVVLENAELAPAAPAQPAEPGAAPAPTAPATAVEGVLRSLEWGFADLSARLGKHSTVAIVYSPRSVRAGWLADYLAAEGTAPAAASAGTGALAAWPRILGDLGYDFQWLSADDVESGALARVTPAAVILPEMWSVTPGAAQALDAYAAAGGLLIADNAAGLLDGDYLAYASSPLDAVFGLKRRPLTGVVMKELAPAARAADLSAIADGPLAAAAGGQGALAAPRSRGAGGTVYLNRFVEGYRDPADQTSAAFLLQMETVFAAAGIAPPLVVYQDDKPLRASVRVYSSTRTSVYYVTLSNPVDAGAALQVRLRSSGSVYNLRPSSIAGEFLGTGNTLSVAAPPSGPIVISGTDVQLSAFLFEASYGAGQIYLNGQIFAEAAPGDRLVRIEAYMPDGSRAAQFDRVVTAPRGVYIGSISLPINAPRGVLAHPRARPRNGHGILVQRHGRVA